MKCRDCVIGLVLVSVGLMGCERASSDPVGRVTSFSGSEAPVASVQVAPLPSVSEGPKPTVAKSPVSAAPTSTSTLKLKRLVVTTGVENREPLASASALPSDGSPIFAFAELANPDGESENVRITFERQGGVERVGNVTLPVPGKVSRHRTWATTRFIRAPGVWEAVLWNESGKELGRTSFEVSAPSS